MSEGRTYLLFVVSRLRWRLGPLFFLIIFNCRRYSSLAGWTSTSALAWLTQVIWPFLYVSAFSSFFFFLSLLSQKYTSRSLSLFLNYVTISSSYNNVKIQNNWLAVNFLCSKWITIWQNDHGWGINNQLLRKYLSQKLFCSMYFFELHAGCGPQFLDTW